MSYETNPYYNPQSRGLTVVGELEDPGASYTASFTTLVVWTDGKRLLWATDSGCSCPCPFEDIEPEPATKADICRAIDRWVNEVSEYRDQRTRAEAANDGVALKAKVREWRAGGAS